MGESSYDGSIILNRKLNQDETVELRRLLTHELKFPQGAGDTASNEDISDLLDYTLAMVSNGKSVDYAIQELINMEMDFCTTVTAHRVGAKLAEYLRSLPVDSNDVHEDNAAIDNKDSDGSRIISLKSGGEKGNALTMSGALGASRERKRLENNNGHQFNRRGGGGRDGPNNRSNRGGRGGGRGPPNNHAGKNDNNIDNHRNDGDRREDYHRQDNNRADHRGGRGRETGGRSVVSAAFDRLIARQREQGRGNQGAPSPRRERDQVHGDQRHDGQRNARGPGGNGRGGFSTGGQRDDFDRRQLGGRGRDNPRTTVGGRSDGGRLHNGGVGRPENNTPHREPEHDFTPSGRGRGRIQQFGQRGGRDGRGGTPFSGNRRPREEGERENNFTPTGRGGRFGGGRGGGGSDGDGRNIGDAAVSNNKRPRTDDGNDVKMDDNGHDGQAGYEESYEDHNYDEEYYEEPGYYHAYPPYRGRGYNGVGRGRGRGGRFNRTYHTPSAAEHDQNEQYPPADEATPQEMEQESFIPGEGAGEEITGDPHPSPLVNAAFGGRGYGFRGGRGRGRGRGRGFLPGREEVATMIASKSWVRPKPNENPDSGNGDSGDPAPQT